MTSSHVLIFLTNISLLDIVEYDMIASASHQAGWCVITKNLFSIARYQERRKGHGQIG
jgi:hypothetical protein